MPVEVALRFTTGQYQATPWDHAANEGISEWPPGSWRILRALIATRHTRCPSVPEDDLDSLISALASEQPLYRLPDTYPSHTRHYLPGIDHRTDRQGETALQFAARLNLDPDDPVRVLWQGVELSARQQEQLAVLLDQLPYLGRADSRCEAHLVPERSLSVPDETWARPSPDGSLDVLTAVPEVTRSQLELSADDVRRKRYRIPPGAAWTRYEAPDIRRAAASPSHPLGPTTVRWLLHSRAPFGTESGVLATHGLRGAVLGTKGTHEWLKELPDSWLVAGPHADKKLVSDHRHAHWLWIPHGNGVSELALWIPSGIPEQLLYRIISARALPRFEQAPRGYRGGAELHLQAMGSAAMVLPELTDRHAVRWRSVTPMLTDRFPKRNRDRREFAQKEVERELAFRWGDDAPKVTVDLLADWESHQVTRYRRYRWTENMSQRRRGMLLEITLAEPLPLSATEEPDLVALGALSHFGFGLFSPIGQ